ncbi:hypothetical protein BMW23_0320 [Bodo saltans virus]|jgi:hypothetical protein|uniref:Uncharacterized protein n=1 Tax=Bodo saltans virus TaxID=2024608 RepID=A0A2H4UU44_9VIRU|nr:hypothetical protein QJ851_gp0314 [Bodo saltans virus]ATZ80377.1 hypothetical protein BMW23_0320 [Bodo saltans virus]
MLDNVEKRMLLFLCVCIVIRIILVYAAKNINIEYLPYMGYFGLMLSIGFMYIYLTNSRQTGAEVFGDKIWWNSLRPIHSILWGLFAYNAINKNDDAWAYLAVDVFVGFVGFAGHEIFGFF